MDFRLSDYDLKQGDVVTMMGGGASVAHTVRQLFVTGIDLEAQTVAGTIDGTEDVHVWIGSVNLEVPAERAWLADFSGHDPPLLSPGACGGAEAWGTGGSSTIVDWCVPAPPQPAFPVGSHDGAFGESWASGCSAFGWVVDPGQPERELTVRILADDTEVAKGPANVLRSDVPDCTDGTCGFGFNLWGLITPGLEHTITAQAYDYETETWVSLAGTPKTLTCWGYPEGFHDGSAGIVDQDNCTAFGWVVDPDDQARDVRVEILSDDNWVAEVNANLLREDVEECTDGICGFSVNLWDLISPDVQHSITAQAYDEETSQWLNLEATPKGLTCQSPPPPWLIAFPENEAVEVYNWPAGASLHLSIDKGADGSPDLERDVTLPPEGEYDGWARIDLAGAYDLESGDVVSVTDGVAPRSLVVESLAVVAVDMAGNTVSGTASENASVQVWPHEFDQTATVDVIAVGGTWTADFTGVFTLTSDTCGRSRILDDDDDSTAVDWCVPPPPNPSFTDFPEGEIVEGWDWPLGAVIHLSIEDPATELSPDFEQDATVTLTPWGSGQLWVWFEFPGFYDMKPGDTVTLTDGVTPRVHVVQDLSITAADPEQNTVAGTAPRMRT